MALEYDACRNVGVRRMCFCRTANEFDRFYLEGESIMEPEDVTIWLGIDVGKTDHWAAVVNDAGEQGYSHSLPNDESKLRQIYADLAAHGRMRIVVDQPATIGALAVAVAQAMGIAVAYLPGLAMRRIAKPVPR